MVPPRLYGLADADALAPQVLSDAVGAMAAAGVGWIQIRAKSLSDRELELEVARSVRAVGSTGTALWINDRADLAAANPVQGLHLGQDDLPPRVAREIVGDAVWIGLSTHSIEQVEAAESDPAVDVIAVGPVFATRSKSGSGPASGLDLVRSARQRTDKPLVAIGGIDSESAGRVLEAGADCVAVIGALCRGDLRRNLRLWEALL